MLWFVLVWRLEQFGFGAVQRFGPGASDGADAAASAVDRGPRRARSR